jgi:hypothetical protein
MSGKRTYRRRPMKLTLTPAEDGSVIIHQCLPGGTPAEIGRITADALGLTIILGQGEKAEPLVLDLAPLHTFAMRLKFNGKTP